MTGDITISRGPVPGRHALTRLRHATASALGLLCALTMLPGSAESAGPSTHVEFSLSHTEIVGGVQVVLSDSNPGLDDTDIAQDTGVVIGTYGIHNVDVTAEVASQANGAPRLRAQGVHDYDLSGVDRRTDYWRQVTGHQLVRATLVDDLSFTNPPPGDFTVEFYWDVYGYDKARIDLGPGDSVVYDFETGVRLEATTVAPNSGGSLYTETVPWPGGYLNSDLSQTKDVSDYVVMTFDVSAGSDLSVETSFEVEPDTLLDNGPEGIAMSLLLEGEHTAQFYETADLVGVVIRDSLGDIVPAVTISTGSGHFYEVLDEVPEAPLPDRMILSPVAVIDTDLGEASPTQAPLVNMINQSGLDKPFISGVTGFDYYLDFGVTPSAQVHFSGNWQGEADFNLPVEGYVDFDLGGTYWIDRVALWNLSLEDIRVQISDSSTGPWQEVGQFTLGSHIWYFGAYPADILDLGGEHEASYVRIQVDSAHKSSPSDTFAWPLVGEVAVSASPTPVPEPEFWMLASAGILGLGVLHRARLRRV